MLIKLPLKRFTKTKKRARCRFLFFVPNESSRGQSCLSATLETIFEEFKKKKKGNKHTLAQIFIERVSDLDDRSSVLIVWWKSFICSEEHFESLSCLSFAVRSFSMSILYFVQIVRSSTDLRCSTSVRN